MTPDELLRTLEADPELATALTDADLEQIVAGKGGGGGGSSLGRMSQMNNVMAGFLDNQARMFRNTGINPSSSSFERLAGRGINLSGVGSSLRRVR